MINPATVVEAILDFKTAFIGKIEEALTILREIAAQGKKDK